MKSSANRPPGSSCSALLLKRNFPRFPLPYSFVRPGEIEWWDTVAMEALETSKVSAVPGRLAKVWRLKVLVCQTFFIFRHEKFLQFKEKSKTNREAKATKASVPTPPLGHLHHRQTSKETTLWTSATQKKLVIHCATSFFFSYPRRAKRTVGSERCNVVFTLDAVY